MSSHSAAILVDVFMAPQQAFSSLKRESKYLFPAVLVVSLYAGMFALFFATVNFGWLVEQLVRHGRSAEEQAGIRQGLAVMNPTVMAGLTIGSTVVKTAGLYLLYATYILLASKLSNDNLRFSQGLALIAWANAPAVFSVLASLVTILTASDGHLLVDDVAPLTLDALVLHLPPNHALKSWATSVDLPHIWGGVLLVIGYRVWTERSLRHAALLTLSPIAAAYGVWLMLALH